MYIRIYYIYTTVPRRLFVTITIVWFDWRARAVSQVSGLEDEECIFLHKFGTIFFCLVKGLNHLIVYKLRYINLIVHICKPLLTSMQNLSK